jgi:hypothetical protein
LFVGGAVQEVEELDGELAEVVGGEGFELLRGGDEFWKGFEQFEVVFGGDHLDCVDVLRVGEDLFHVLVGSPLLGGLLLVHLMMGDW